MNEIPLLEDDAPADPLHLFERWLQDARDSEPELPEAMALATATPDGQPSVRMVLLKGFDEAGFVFYTNFVSRKAAELDANPRAALMFHWKSLQRQVRIEVTCQRTSTEESAEYFATRPRGSRLGAWASEQSHVVEDRDALDRRYAETEQRFHGGEVPLPEFWGGYRGRPRRIEFWQGRADRMHDRLVYERDADTGSWRLQRLYP